MQRRNFLKNTALGSSAVLVPNFLQAYSSNRIYNSRSEKILVVIQLSGGNDGLNTIIPYRNDVYYRKRPTLAIGKENVLKVGEELGFNPSLAALQSLYENGEMTIINSVGYPNPDRSHFRSMDIWHTASGSEEYWATGWLGRYLDSNCMDCLSPHHMLELDESLSLAMKGEQRSGFAAENMHQLQRITKNRFLKAAAKKEHHHEEENVAYLYKTMIETQQSANYLYEKAKVHKSTIEYPQDAFGKDLKQIAELITADTDTRIYYASLSGFDTHAFQKVPQNR
ncbi:MAG: twin-arginine translocation pathway signal, partial [Bacteroidota bacterium]